MAETLRDRLERRLSGMKQVRADYEPEYNDIARFAQPARSRFLTTKRDKGAHRRRQNSRLIDTHGIRSFRTLASGLTSGNSSASRPWFSLGLRNSDVSDEPEVRAWLSEAERALYAFLSSTNVYGALKSGYAENGLFGTEACVMVEDDTFGMVCHALTAGEYWIGVSSGLVPDTLFRACPMTVRQAVQQYGKPRGEGIGLPRWVMDAYDRSDYTAEVEMYQAIEPNAGHDPRRFGSKPWVSATWCANDDRDNAITETGGSFDKPFWAARWDVVGGDTYGVSPGMEALPALRDLQAQARKRNRAIDSMVDPEKVVPATIRLTGEPGSVVTSASSVDQTQVFVPYQVPYQAVAAIGEQVTDCRAEIDGLAYADLFNAITNMRGIQPRNVEEIAARNEEKLTQLGPVIERIATEKLEPVIDRAFGIMLRGDLLPPIPEPLVGMKIDIEFISILAQMQRMVGIGQIERTASFVGNLMGAFPEAGDKLNIDEMIDEYGYRAGAPAKMIRSTKDVEAMRAQRAQQQQMAQMAQMAPAMKQGVEAAALLAETDDSGMPLAQRLMPA